MNVTVPTFHIVERTRALGRLYKKHIVSWLHRSVQPHPPSQTTTPTPSTHSSSRYLDVTMIPLFTILIYGFRAANITHAEYKDHYDNVHVPLAKSIAGHAWPISHTRHYFGGNASLAAISAPVDWDSLAVLTFKDETHAFTFNHLIGQPEAAAKIHADEKLFMSEDSPKMVVIGTDTSITNA